MSDSANTPCGCNDSRGSSSAPAASLDDGLGKVLKAQVPQDYDAKFNLRIVPNRSLGDTLVAAAGCQPRGHRKGWEAGAVALAVPTSKV